MSNPQSGVGSPVKISLTPSAVPLTFGQTAQLGAPVLTDSTGAIITATKPLSYTSSNPSAVTVSSSGLVTATSGSDWPTGSKATIEVAYPAFNNTQGYGSNGIPLSKIYCEVAVTVIPAPSVTITPWFTQDEPAGQAFAGYWAPGQQKVVKA
jgi:uncharacterized protein YjdB